MRRVDSGAGDGWRDTWHGPTSGAAHSPDNSSATDSVGNWAVQKAAHMTGGVRDSARERRRRREMARVTE